MKMRTRALVSAGMVSSQPRRHIRAVRHERLGQMAADETVGSRDDNLLACEIH
jgi:hypothetical protein